MAIIHKLVQSDYLDIIPCPFNHLADLQSDPTFSQLNPPELNEAFSLCEHIGLQPYAKSRRSQEKEPKHCFCSIPCSISMSVFPDSTDVVCFDFEVTPQLPR